MVSEISVNLRLFSNTVHSLSSLVIVWELALKLVLPEATKGGREGRGRDVSHLAVALDARSRRFVYPRFSALTDEMG